MPDRAAANTPGTSSVRLRRLLRTPLLVKILVANGAVVALGATVGTALTAAHVRRSPDAQAYGLMVVFAVCGLAISLVVNGALLRAALRPLARLEVVARRVSAGDLGARVRLGAVGDPTTDRLAAAFNTMLDRLGERNRQLAAAASRLRELSDRVLLAQEEERARLAGQLLDATAQELAAVLLNLRLLQNAAARPGADAAALGRQLAGLTEQVRATLDGLRRLAADLRPRLLDDLGLAAAVRSLVGEWAARTGIPVALTAALPPGAHVPPATAIAVYRMTQEALANVERHARATQVDVTLAVGGGALVAEVRDDGRGPPTAASRPASPDDAAATSGPIPRLGLFAAEERIGLVQGRFAVESAPGGGTTVRAVVPLPRDSPRHTGPDQRGRSATDSGAPGADPAAPDRPAARGA